MVVVRRNTQMHADERRWTQIQNQEICMHLCASVSIGALRDLVLLREEQ